MCVIGVLSIAAGSTPQLRAQSVDELQQQIVQGTSQIDSLKNEIAQLQTQLSATSKQKQTLQTAVKGLDLNIRKTTKTIALTNAQIAQKDTEIQTLSGGIATTSVKINITRGEVADSLMQLSIHDDEPLALMLLSNNSLSSFFDETAALESMRTDLQGNMYQLSNLKTTLQNSKYSDQQKRQELATLEANLSQQQESLAIARQTQSDLLAKTKDQESNYQTLLAQKKAQEAKFEQDLLDYESQLNLKVSKGSLPPTGSAPLSWPLDNVIITQYFGNTPFATANSQIYNGKGHTGIDFGASPGTPIKAARGGVVLGTGNTDLTCPNASFGKWIFIKHDDGLSTLYAHLAVIGVTKGQSVSTGELIGYSDTTGYATGPHLHFGVYASSGSEIASFASKGCPGKTYTMPVGDVSAYLNPLSYLPAH